MRKLLAIFLLLPVWAMADVLPEGTVDLLRGIQGLVRVEQVVARPSGTERDAEAIGLLIPASEMLASPTELTEGGRMALRQFRSYARLGGRKLTVLLPDERAYPDYRRVAFRLDGVEVRRNALVGRYVYIVIAGN